MFTHFYRKEHHITLKDDQYIYTLPDDYLALNRLEYRDMMFPVETRNSIDKQEAAFPCALKDNLAYNEIEIVLGEGYHDLRTALVNVFGVVTDSDTDAIDINVELDDVYGVVVDVEDTVTEPTPQPLDDLLVYYTAVPAILTSADMAKPLIVPDIWFQAFLHFVTGMALQDDNDANNIQRGEMEGTKYIRMLSHIKQTSSKDFTSSIKTKLTTKFRRT
jgi:hypothetical protein